AAEQIRRAAGDRRAAAGAIELEQVAIRPHIGGVVADEDRQIADKADAAAAGAVPQLAQLAVDEELHEPLARQRRRELALGRAQRVRIAVAQPARPPPPVVAAVSTLERNV